MFVMALSECDAYRHGVRGISSRMAISRLRICCLRRSQAGHASWRRAQVSPRPFKFMSYRPMQRPSP